MSDRIRVLCLDDEKNILNVIRRQLDDDFFEIYQALTAEEALRVLQTAQPIHVVLSDYRMPGMNGIEFLETVSTRWPWISGVIISGFADTQAVQLALVDNSFVGFIAKPWAMEELRKVIINAARMAQNKLSGEETP